MKFFSSTRYTPQQLQNNAIDLFCDVLGSILSAIGIYTFAKLANFAPGGISGVALILNHLWNLPIGTTSLVINIPLILLSYRIVGRKFMIKSIRTILINTFFLDFVFPLTPAYDGNPMLAALFSGVFFGCGLALIYMRGCSPAVRDFLIMSIKALHPHLSLGAVTMAIDLVIILIGWPVFGNLDAVLYGLISTFVTSTVIDKIMYGTSAGKPRHHHHDAGTCHGNAYRRGLRKRIDADPRKRFLHHDRSAGTALCLLQGRRCGCSPCRTSDRSGRICQ